MVVGGGGGIGGGREGGPHNTEDVHNIEPKGFRPATTSSGL